MLSARNGTPPLITSMSAQHPRPVIDTSRANPGRVWNYWLGGKDNYPVDRELGEQVRTRIPAILDIARAGRGFLLRAVRHLTGAEGVRQFLFFFDWLTT